VDICVPDRLPQSLGLCRMPGGGDKKSMGLNNNSCDSDSDSDSDSCDSCD